MRRLRHVQRTSILAQIATMWLFGSVAAAAQPATAILEGRVVDPTGAAVGPARVTARHNTTGSTWLVFSDGVGRFILPMLPPGTFSIEVSIAPFSAWSARDVSLAVGQRRHLDIQPTLPGGREEVTVRGTVNFTAAVQDVLSNREIETLPLNGRNYLELALMVPGNQPAPTFDPTKTNTVIVGSAGQLGRGGNVAIERAGQ
jgi:Carboxypeptidase regulatory-like domain